jgi:glutamate synthase domain-containing protein 3
VKKHFDYTGSKRAQHILENWETEKDNFWKIIPGEYKKALARMAKEEAAKKAASEKEVING